jgi:hypothetical protein
LVRRVFFGRPELKRSSAEWLPLFSGLISSFRKNSRVDAGSMDDRVRV